MTSTKGELENKLKEKLFQHLKPPENERYLHGGIDWLLKEIFDDGVFYDVSSIAQRRGMKNGECHMNACKLHIRYGYRIVTGYAFASDSGWLGHSWVLDDDGRIIETTSNKYEMYYGYSVQDDVAGKFIHRMKISDKIMKASPMVFGFDLDFVYRCIRDYYTSGEPPTRNVIAKCIAEITEIDRKTIHDYLGVLLEDKAIVIHDGLLEIPGEKPVWGNGGDDDDYYYYEDDE